MDIVHRVHWLSITIWTSYRTFQRIWDQRFSPIFGELICLRHGGSGFRLIHQAVGDVKVYSDPINVGKDDETFISVRFPGSACDALPPNLISEFMRFLEESYKFSVTRIDLALDYAPFTPEEFFQAIDAGKVRTYAKRETFKYFSSPNQPQEDGGEIGCFTAQVGSPSSDRKVRVYNKRGFTRVELEARKKRADAIAKSVLVKDPTYWGEQFIGHLRDFIDLVEDKETGTLVKFWGEFVQSIPRAGLTVTDPKELEKDKLMNWLMTQVASAYSAMLDIYGAESHKALYNWGKKKRGDRYDAILPEEAKRANYKVGEEDD